MGQFVGKVTHEPSKTSQLFLQRESFDVLTMNKARITTISKITKAATTAES